MRQLRKNLFAWIQIICLMLLIHNANAVTSDWRQVSFIKPDDLVSYFHRINYSLDNWQQGDRSIPRVYLSHIPASWREQYAGELSTQEKKRYFFFMLTPMILRANETINAQRVFVTDMQQQTQWSQTDTIQLTDIAEEYGVTAPTDSIDANAFEKLLRRVDVVPVSLAMAQAAIESGWGTSRFASEGNALFGQWTWSEDAIAPERVRTELGNYGIRSFPTPFESIAAYMHNLNTHDAYRHLRDLREQTRNEQRPLSGTELAAGLEKYSERGEMYVKEVRSLIAFNGLDELDKAYLRDGVPVKLIPTSDDV